mmetsp:Transcript_20456/g.56747  ORF Transcript_20456/g.56747 Transcript_20456/m.56747 type:complete len:468 (+) Transcript_20456:118-1521(+)
MRGFASCLVSVAVAATGLSTDLRRSPLPATLGCHGCDGQIQHLELLQVKASYVVGEESDKGRNNGTLGELRAVRSTDEWFATPGGSTFAVTAATYGMAWKLMRDAAAEAERDAKKAESGGIVWGKTDLDLPLLDRGATCHTCIEGGHTWCASTQDEVAAASKRLLGRCVLADDAPSGTAAKSGAQCFSETDLCPLIRPAAVAEAAPARIQIGATQTDGRPEWDNSPLVDVAHKFVFCEIPKVACTDFKRLFRRLGGEPDYESQAPWIHDPKMNGILRLTDFRDEVARRIMMDAKWTKAVFVRDPMERLLSGFLDKCREPVGTRYDIHCPFAGEVSFGTFMRYIFGQAARHSLGAMAMDEHWRPQHMVCDLRSWLPYYQFQGNFSHLREHTKFLLQGTGLFDEFGRGWGNDSGATDLFEVKADWHQTSTSDKIKKYYTKELADLARDFYRVDYELFELPLPRWYYELD